MRASLSAVGRIITAAVVVIAPLSCSKSETTAEAPKTVTREFTPEDFSKVKAGMTEDEVKEIVGDPKDTMEALGVTRKFYQVGDKYYSISFKEGKVGEPLGPTTKQDDDFMRGMMQAAKQMEQKKNAGQ
jgi:outer membrane protein assembly factor BamE (lipoprotein component of BamABCDE complex)